jgi:hypothetical protein
MGKHFPPGSRHVSVSDYGDVAVLGFDRTSPWFLTKPLTLGASGCRLRRKSMSRVMIFPTPRSGRFPTHASVNRLLRRIIHMGLRRVIRNPPTVPLWIIHAARSQHEASERTSATE